jgi:hypothetical protein
MNEFNEITSFMQEARTDPRIGPLHISLYTALVYAWSMQGGKGPVSFTSRELMPIAKIGGRSPFCRCIQQLHQYGYIIYEPSFDPAVKSRVYLPVYVEFSGRVAKSV